MNSIIRPNFKEKFTEICTYGSREQCTRPIQENVMRTSFVFSAIQTYTWYLLWLEKTHLDPRVVWTSCNIKPYAVVHTRLVGRLDFPSTPTHNINI